MINQGKISLKLSDFTDLVELHLRNWIGTRDLERQAIKLSDIDFEEQQLIRFIRDVCIWGNYAGIAGRVIKQNDINMLREKFKDALNELDHKNPDVSNAI